MPRKGSILQGCPHLYLKVYRLIRFCCHFHYLVFIRNNFVSRDVHPDDAEKAIEWNQEHFFALL